MQSIGKKKNICTWQISIFFSEFKVLKSIIRNFFFFSELQKKMSTEIYGDFWVEFLHDKGGEKLWVNNLFLNIYDFWCIRRFGYLLKDYRTKNSLLKRIIRKKLRGNKGLPAYKVLLKMCAKREYFIRWSIYMGIGKIISIFWGNGRKFVKKTF